MRTLLTLLFCFFTSLAFSQEFRGKVTVNSQQIQSSDRKVFDLMQQAINDFIYSKPWTNLNLAAEERLDCNINLMLKRQISKDNYEGQLTIQLNRPVYNSTYTTPMFNFVEKDFTFVFTESQVLEFDINTYHSNLTSALAYYSYLMLGIYFDSFSKQGGTPFFDIAQNIVQLAGSANQTGWRSNEKNTRNKYWILENYTNPAYAKVREASYIYHRLALDKMTLNQPEARQSIISALQSIQPVNKAMPNSSIVQLFMDTKIPEIINIYTPAPETEQQAIVTLIRELSPVNISKFKGFSGT